MRIDRPFGEAVTGAHAVALVHAQVLARGDLVQLRLRPFVGDPLATLDARRRDEHLALAALDVAKLHDAVDFGDRRRILRATRFKEFCHARKTTGDVARLVRLARDLGDRVAGVHLVAILGDQHGADRDDEVADLLLLPALRLPDLDVRVELLLAVLDDDALAQAGQFIELLGNGLVLDDVDEANDAFDVGKDRVGVRVPREDDLLLLHLVAVLHEEGGAERHREARADRRRLVGRGADGDLAFVRGDDLLSLAVGDEHQAIPKLDDAGDLRLARRLLGDTCGRSADVEGAQRQLRARLADGLRGDDADGLAQVDHLHGRQVASVAHAAQTTLCLAGEHRADLHRLDPRLLDGVRRFLVDELTGLGEHHLLSSLFTGVRIHHVVGGHGADDALAERLDDILAFLQRADLQPLDRAAILLGDRDVLRHVDETTREVSGVGRLERGVGQTLACAVGRDEVLEHRQPFAEVRLDRALDDFADATGELLLRLRHEAAHPRQLADLVAATA